MTTVLLLSCCATYAQVRNIRSSSALRSGGGEAFSYGYMAYLIFDLMTSGVADWQKATLNRKSEIPSIVSLDVMLQVASQPSRYYVVNPRIRANWGIFLTDLRTNYMVEHVPGGVDDLRTDDWQVLGLYMINERNFNLRISSGILSERFGAGRKFNESVVGGEWRSGSGKLGAFGEYRWAKDRDAGETPRTEINCSIYTTIVNRPGYNISFTIGGVYQQYYSEVPVWGLQGGIRALIHHHTGDEEPF
jgi:hypothetical protein